MNQIDPPITLSDLFGNDDSSCDDDDDDDDERRMMNRKENNNHCCYEVQNYNLWGKDLQIRQYAFHSHNANQVWPGTFNLCDYLFTTHRNSQSNSSGSSSSCWGDMLELGSATGLLAIRLSMELNTTDNKNEHAFCSSIVTSDVQEEGNSNQVEQNIQHNFRLNGFVLSENSTTTNTNTTTIPIHMPHLWGTSWDKAAVGLLPHGTRFDTVIASDILLYVSAYPALVQTLKELLDPSLFPVPNLSGNKNPRFVMSWNRRMKESIQFFDLMTDAGFQHTNEGKCVYTFWKEEVA
mmetsp:Transcript_20481/g.29211  ORF Transcript_20481/g.29211 Transcript_20481/m.29211 type:complete len:293 (+) Transcript_20481:39-917(+)